MGHWRELCTEEKLSEPQATGLAGWSGRLGLIATGVTCLAPMCMLLSVHLLHRSRLPPGQIPVLASTATGVGMGGPAPPIPCCDIVLQDGFWMEIWGWMNSGG